MGDDRGLAVEALLNQLWLGLSAYRLFPGSVEHVGFVAAVERIGTAARAALGWGPVDVEIRGDRFVLDGVELHGDEHLRKLALTLFERRVERLVVGAVPDVRDLDLLYEVLMREADDLDAEGGAGEVLGGRGVGAVQLARVGPAPVEGADHVAAGLEAVEGGAPPIASDLSAGLLLEDLPGTPDDQAEALLSRLTALIDTAPASARAIDLHATVHDLVADLPPSIRRPLVSLLVDRVGTDPVVERLISTMSNAELTHALVDLGRAGGRDPIELARELAREGVRPLDIVDLTAALESGRVEAGTIIAGLEQLGIDTRALGEGAPPSSVTDAIVDYLGATRGDDDRAIQAVLERTEDQRRADAIVTLGDYLILETDLARTGEALDLWAGELRQALRSRDVHGARSLARAARDALVAAGDDRVQLFEAYVRHGLDPDVVADLVWTETVDDGGIVQELLGAFGALGVDVLLDLLAAEDDRDRRAKLLGVARQLVPDHVEPVVARLSDPRWYVVRNAVILLGASGRPDVLPTLERLARHPSEVVRGEVPFALVAAAGIDAVPALERLARGSDGEVQLRCVSALGTVVGARAEDALVQIVRSSDERALRLAALEELGRRPGGRGRLDELASRASRPRVPWTLRRRARSLSRRGDVA